MASNFSSIPILDYSLTLDPERKGEFIAQLRHALINVGFLYLANPPVPREDIDAVIDYAPRLLDIPQDAKDKIGMANSEHFYGYSRLGAEITKGKTDQREQFDFGTECDNVWKPGDPDYMRLWGPAQWPEEELIPGFKATMSRYLAAVEKLSFEFTNLLAEALGLPPDALKAFYETEMPVQHWAKVVKYPALDNLSSDQGVGPHFDAGFLTFLLQASPHAGLQVQNMSGEWVDAPPIPGTFVVNIGKALETVTQGLARATSHRVLSPPKGSTPRYSIPFFQNISLRVSLKDITLELNEEIMKFKEQRGGTSIPDSINYAEYGQLPTGQVNLIGRIRSHPDVGQRHYPGLFKQIFPQGLPVKGEAY